MLDFVILMLFRVAFRASAINWTTVWSMFIKSMSYTKKPLKHGCRRLTFVLQLRTQYFQRSFAKGNSLYGMPHRLSRGQSTYRKDL